jgi:hypothetical protein
MASSLETLGEDLPSTGREEDSGVSAAGDKSEDREEELDDELDALAESVEL